MTAVTGIVTHPTEATRFVSSTWRLNRERHERYLEVKANHDTAKVSWYLAMQAGDVDAEQRFLTEMDSADCILTELERRGFGMAA